MRRFLLHVLPPGLQRIRYYGLLGNRRREEKLARCRKLLQMPVKLTEPEPTEAIESTSPEMPLHTLADYRDRYEALTGLSLHQCPFCQKGRMIVTARIESNRKPPVLEHRHLPLWRQSPSQRRA